MCAPYMLQLGRISKTAFCEISHFTTFAEYLTFSRLRRIEQLQSYLYTNGINIANPLPLACLKTVFCKISYFTAFARDLIFRS